jgi:GNAT superfamily N-acetyltransferase
MQITSIGYRQVAELPRCRADCLASVEDNPRWAAAAESRWGVCGLTAIDADVVGYALIAPAWHASDIAAWRSDPRDGYGSERSGAIIVDLWADSHAHGLDVHRLLIESLAERLVQAGDHALDAHGARFRPTCLCPSVRVLQRCGFQVVAEHAVTPVLRLDLDRTVRRTSRLGVWGRFVTAVRRPDLPPAPAQRGAQTWVQGRPGTG